MNGGNGGFDFMVVIAIWGTAFLVFLPRFLGVGDSEQALVGLANALSSIARNIAEMP